MADCEQKIDDSLLLSDGRKKNSVYDQDAFNQLREFQTPVRPTIARFEHPIRFENPILWRAYLFWLIISPFMFMGYWYFYQLLTSLIGNVVAFSSMASISNRYDFDFMHYNGVEVRLVVSKKTTN